ncbi:hypothetical protein SADUNF_Sadunf11G0058100 [Salix dunnii]|uniref:Uncharacterized protein n=1 Tax=Salix dunnii TaxID=1413687 RepID=A0A835MT79_9ROSI|nr:hypothetical protein SADUNF_Sadunf11G0058100 [Salix dunnii]
MEMTSSIKKCHKILVWSKIVGLIKTFCFRALVRARNTRVEDYMRMQLYAKLPKASKTIEVIVREIELLKMMKEEESAARMEGAMKHDVMKV